MKRLTSRLDQWIHGFLPAIPEGLAFSRIVFAAYFLFVRGVPRFSWVSNNPPGYFDPPPLSLPALMADFPSVAPLRALDLIVLILFIFLLTGFKTKTTSVVLSLAWILGNSFRYSFGKIDHDIITVITPLVMAFSGWGATWSIDAKRSSGSKAQVQAWPLSLLALLLAFGFLSAGLPKLLGWIDFDLQTQGTRMWLFKGWYQLDRTKLLAPFFMGIDNPYFWEALDLLAVTFEISFSLSLIRRQLFRTYLFVAVMFHFANLLMLNIGFLTLLPVYFIFAPWEHLVGRLPLRLTSAMDRIGSWRGMVAMLVLFGPLCFFLDRLGVSTYFTPFGLASDLWLGGLDLRWATTVAVLPIAVLIVLALSGLPRGRPIRSNLLPRDGAPVVFFNGTCQPIHRRVDRAIRRGRAAGLRSESLQSDLGKGVIQAVGTDRLGHNEGILLVDTDGLVYEQADAMLKIMIPLGGVCALLASLWLMPRPIRNALFAISSSLYHHLLGRRKA